MITEHLGLPGFSKEAALLCLDKSLMHERFVQRIGSQSTARFKKVSSKKELMAFAQNTGLPIILKPTNLYNSLFVSLNWSQEELLQNYEVVVRELQGFLQKAGQYHVSPSIQAEEFLQGSTYSIDCIVDSAGNVTLTPIVDIISGRDIGWSDFHHFARVVPSRLTTSQQEALYSLAVAGVQALEIRSNIAHVELVQTSQGPKLLEIGARPGGNRARLFDLSSGIDLIYAYYQVRSGMKAEIEYRQTVPTAIVSPYSRKQGVLTEIRHLDRITQLKTYFAHEVKVNPGQAVGPSASGYTAPLSIELRSELASDLYQNMQEIQSWQDLFLI
ncbi:MAG TPA: ATP-grasp domain-containing protein [Ktedonosporobacter sp.]|nr:ATP-grasp domain-containing protein [Ktedonosporobacter sp.]